MLSAVNPERSESYSETYFVTLEIFIFSSLLCEHIQEIGFVEFLKNPRKILVGDKGFIHFSRLLASLAEKVC